jgi:Zn-dependent protease
MGWSWKLGRVGGIEIKMHASFLLALIWGAVAWGGGRLSGLAYGALLTLVLFAIVLLHELGHSLAAKHYGIPVQDIILLPIGGVARLSRMPEKPVEELAVALAGPAVNLLFVLLLGPLLILAGASDLPNSGLLPSAALSTPSIIGFARFLLLINASLLLFNLIPAFPLDGGRVLRALLALKLPYVRATGLAVIVGRALAIAMSIFGLVTLDFFLVIIGFFIFAGAGAEGEEAKARASIRDMRVTEALTDSQPVLTFDIPVHQAFDRLVRLHQPALAVVDQDGCFLGVVTAAGIQRRWRLGVRGPLSVYVDEPEVVLDCQCALDVARDRMIERQAWVAPVYCGKDFAGLLDLQTIGRFIASRVNQLGAGQPGLGTTASP